ncbi:MAG TPA: nucleoside monophosphate kinase [Acidimicrobiales bacterium]|nr:nucleoside monophosphate kinase [Acidimicrobiales bacterium]
MRLVLLGAPGAGKGTQAAALAGYFGVPHISSGDLLRGQVDAGTELGRQVAAHLDRGELAPDDIVASVVADALADSGADGYVLEGFPRTVTQAQWADALQPSGLAEAVVLLELPDDEARHRLAERAAAGRSDDRDPEVIQERLRRFHAETEPVVDYYRDRGVLTTVDAAQPPDAVRAAILTALAETPGPA